MREWMRVQGTGDMGYFRWFSPSAEKLNRLPVSRRRSIALARNVYSLSMDLSCPFPWSPTARYFWPRTVSCVEYHDAQPDHEECTRKYLSEKISSVRYMDVAFPYGS